jgi:hypothetical protein
VRSFASIGACSGDKDKFLLKRTRGLLYQISFKSIWAFFSRPSKSFNLIEIRSPKRNSISEGIFYIMGQISKVFVHPPFEKRKFIKIGESMISKVTILSIPKMKL